MSQDEYISEAYDAQKEQALAEKLLHLLKLETKKFQTMFELIESLAWKKLARKIEPQKPTEEHRESLFDYVPWTFFPNAKAPAHMVREGNRKKFQKLKRQLEALAETIKEIAVE